MTRDKAVRIYALHFSCGFTFPDEVMDEVEDIIRSDLSICGADIVTETLRYIDTAGSWSADDDMRGEP